MIENLRSKLARGDLLIGTIITLPSPAIAEILCSSGFDWLFIDLEHTALSIQDAQTILQAANPEIPCVIRVPSLDEVWFKKCLDIGAAGVVVPQIRGAGDAERVLRYCKYPPRGARSAGIARAQGYGARFQEYVARANDEIAVILQIEHIDAVENIDRILEVAGIDCLFVGPYDLSASMGKIGLVDDPDVQATIAQVSERVRQARIPLGIFGATPQAVKPYIENGYTLISVSTDTLLLDGAAKRVVDSFSG